MVDHSKLLPKPTGTSKTRSKKRNAEGLYALGKYHLTEGRFNEAIENFNIALAAQLIGQLREPQLLTNLAVAWLEKGKAELNNGQSAQADAAFTRSRSYLDQVLRSQPDAPEALFNLALLHHVRRSWPEAESVWRLYLEKDPSSPWAQEARQYLDQALKAQR